MNVFLTGEVQVGKSTAIRRFLAERPELVPGGFVTVSFPSREPGARWDVYILPARWSERDVIPGRRVGLRGGAGTVFPAAFDGEGVRLLSPPPGCRLLLMDELGRMERTAQVFCRAVLAALDGPVPILGVVKPESNPLLDAVRAHPRTVLLPVTAENRDGIPGQIARHLGPL